MNCTLGMYLPSSVFLSSVALFCWHQFVIIKLGLLKFIFDTPSFLHNRFMSFFSCSLLFSNKHCTSTGNFALPSFMPSTTVSKSLLYGMFRMYLLAPSKHIISLSSFAFLVARKFLLIKMTIG